MTVYNNDDGLNIRFGTDQANRLLVGEPERAGSLRTLEVIIEFGNLPLVAGGPTTLDELASCAIPSGALLKKGTIHVTTTFVGATATLDVGLKQKDGTEIDHNGIFAAVAVADLAEGDEVDATGALIDAAATSVDGFISAEVNTADFTAGKGFMVLEYIVPRA